MASKSAQQEPVKAEVIEEALDTIATTLDRLKALYEQYFLGIQKQPPQHLHTDVERKLRDLAQQQIRNTALRYRFATLQQKFGSYHSYWRRTLREIEAGKYHRNLSKISRQAALTGAEIPEEILAAMPKRMREQVRRDREAVLALQRRRDGAVDEAELLTLAPLDDETGASHAREPAAPRRGTPRPGTGSGMHVLDESDGELDLDAYFKSIQDEDDDEALESTALVPRQSAPSTPRPSPSPVARPPSAPSAGSPAPAVPAPPDSAAAAPAPAPDPGPSAPARARRPASQPSPAAARVASAALPPMLRPTPPSGHAIPASAALPPMPRQTPPSGYPVPPSAALPAMSRQTPPGGHPVPPSAVPPPIPRQPPPIGLPVPAQGGAPTPPGGSRTTTNRRPLTQIATPVPPPAPPPPSQRPAVPRPADPAGSSQQMPAASPSRQMPAVPPPIPLAAGIRPVPPVSHPISRPPTPSPFGPSPQPATGSAAGSGPPPLRTARPISSPAVPLARNRSVETSDSDFDGEESPLHPAQPTPGTRTTPPRLTQSFETRPGFGPSRSPSNPGPLMDPHPAVPPGAKPSPGGPPPQKPPPLAPSQSARPNPIVPGSSVARPPAPVESMSGPFPREPPRPSTPVLRPKSAPRATPEPRVPPPPGMTDADVSALYAKYVKAKELVGEAADPAAYGKLLKTINAQAPKIMEQYKAKGVDFSVVVKDNQVIIRAKPKT